jgi:hypothetical protein
MSNEKKNFWPQSIAAFLILAAFLLTWTVLKTSTMPVHEENLFMNTYQEVDLNSDEIITLNNKFFNRYDVVLVSAHTEKPLEGFYKERKRTTNYIDKTQPIVLEVKSLSGETFTSNLEAMMTRPTTRANDKELILTKLEGNKYELKIDQFDKPGRWQLIAKVNAEGLTGYKSIDIYIE